MKGNGFKIYLKAKVGLYSVMVIFMMVCGVMGYRKVKEYTQVGKRNGDMKEVGKKGNKMVMGSKVLAMEHIMKGIFKMESGMGKVNSSIMMVENIMEILYKVSLMEMV